MIPPISIYAFYRKRPSLHIVFPIFLNSKIKLLNINSPLAEYAIIKKLFHLTGNSSSVTDKYSTPYHLLFAAILCGALTPDLSVELSILCADHVKDFLGSLLLLDSTGLIL